MAFCVHLFISSWLILLGIQSSFQSKKIGPIPSHKVGIIPVVSIIEFTLLCLRPLLVQLMGWKLNSQKCWSNPQVSCRHCRLQRLDLVTPNVFKLWLLRVHPLHHRPTQLQRPLHRHQTPGWKRRRHRSSGSNDK